MSINKKLVIVLVLFLILVSSISFAAEEGIFYYHNDQLGSPRVVTDNIGNIVWSSDYEDFGNTVNEDGDNNYKFTGKELDESTGLYYYGARYYDSSLGRFITADRGGGVITDSQSLNKYSYVKNNPLRYADPSGNEEKNALIILADPKADWNKAFSNFGEDIKVVIDAGYNTVVDTVSTKKEYFEAFENAVKKFGGKLDFYLGGAHGGPTLIALGDEYLTSEDFISHDLSGYFNPGARGLQSSCSVADTTCSLSFAQALANVANIPIQGLIEPGNPDLSVDLQLVEIRSMGNIKKEGFGPLANEGYFESQDLAYSLLKDKITSNINVLAVTKINGKSREMVPNMPLPSNFKESEVYYWAPKVRSLIHEAQPQR